MLGNLLNPKKWTLGTLFNAAGAAGGLMTGGIVPGSQALGMGLTAAGGLFGSGGGGGTYTPGATSGMLGQIGEGDLRFALQNQGRRHQATMNAVDALDPRNDAANAGYFRNSLLRGADLQGRRDRNTLQRQGYASSVGDAAMLDARNRATEQGNEYFASLRNPQSQAGRFAAQSDLLGNMGLFANTMQGQMMLQNQGNAQRIADLDAYNNAPMSGLEGLLGLLGQFGPYLNQGAQKPSNQGNRIYENPIGPPAPPSGINYGQMRGGLF